MRPTVNAPTTGAQYLRGMLIRTALVAVALTGCAANLESSIVSDIRCEPYCAPDDSYLPFLQEAFSYGFAMFPDLWPTLQSCSDLGQLWDCAVTFEPPSDPCGARVVECTGEPAHPPRCHWLDPHRCP